MGTVARSSGPSAAAVPVRPAAARPIVSCRPTYPCDGRPGRPAVGRFSDASFLRFRRRDGHPDRRMVSRSALPFRPGFECRVSKGRRGPHSRTTRRECRAIVPERAPAESSLDFGCTRAEGFTGREVPSSTRRSHPQDVRRCLEVDECASSRLSAGGRSRADSGRVVGSGRRRTARRRSRGLSQARVEKSGSVHRTGAAARATRCSAAAKPTRSPVRARPSRSVTGTPGRRAPGRVGSTARRSGPEAFVDRSVSATEQGVWQPRGPRTRRGCSMITGQSFRSRARPGRSPANQHRSTVSGPRKRWRRTRRTSPKLVGRISPAGLARPATPGASITPLVPRQAGGRPTRR